MDDLGLDDLIVEGGVVAVEWPDRWLNAPAETTRVELRTTGDRERTIRIDDARS